VAITIFGGVHRELIWTTCRSRVTTGRVRRDKSSPVIAVLSR
jgi:hypothetical protein